MSFKVVEVDCNQNCVMHIYEDSVSVLQSVPETYPDGFVLDTKRRIFCVTFYDVLSMSTVVSVCLDWSNGTVVTFRTECVGRHFFRSLGEG